MLWFAVIAIVPVKLEAAEQWRQQWHWLTRSKAQWQEHSNGPEGGHPRDDVDNFWVFLSSPRKRPPVRLGKDKSTSSQGPYSTYSRQTLGLVLEQGSPIPWPL